MGRSPPDGPTVRGCIHERWPCSPRQHLARRRPQAAGRLRRRVTRLGLEGDAHHDVTGHGGTHRAVSILGIEAIGRVAAEGHPIAPGTTGENLTVSGFDVSSLPIGSRLAIGDEVILELAWTANPCRTIRHSFSDLRFGRLSQAAHPADARMYARVVQPGTVRPGDPILVITTGRRRRRARAAREQAGPGGGRIRARRLARR